MIWLLCSISGGGSGRKKMLSINRRRRSFSQQLTLTHERQNSIIEYFNSIFFVSSVGVFFLSTFDIIWMENTGYTKNIFLQTASRSFFFLFVGFYFLLRFIFFFFASFVFLRILYVLFKCRLLRLCGIVFSVKEGIRFLFSSFLLEA